MIPYFSLRRWYSLVLGLVVLCLFGGIVHSSRAEVEITVPRAAITPVVDGSVSSTEYLDAAMLQIPYPDTAFSNNVYAYLVYTPDNLHIAIRFPEARSGVSLNTSSLAFLFDPNFSRDNFAQATDFQIEVPFDGSPPRWLVGNGAGDYAVPASSPSFGPSGQWDVRRGGCLEFTFPCVEMRIARELLGTFDEIDGFATVHRDLTISGSTSSYPAPPDAVYGAPSTWASLLYGGLSAELPRALFIGTVKDVSLDSNVGLGGHPVSIHRADNLDLLYTTTTGTAGDFHFDVPVPPDLSLRIQIPDCANCRFEQPSFGGGGIAPLSSTSLSATFPGCPSGTASCTYRRTDFRLWHPDNVGAVDITSYSPSEEKATIILRDGDPPLTTTPNPRTIHINGVNLHPFGRVYLHPNEDYCRDIPPQPTCPAIEVTILQRSPDGAWIDVVMPEVGVDDYFWVFRDDWHRPANSGTGSDSWRYGPIFPVIMPPFPELYGFGFPNTGDTAGIDEFLAVYQRNAFFCPGIWDGGVCLVFTPIPVPAPPMPEPRYWTIWFPVFKTWLEAGGGNGTCAGMAATSQLMYHNFVSANRYDPTVYYPNGFEAFTSPTRWDHDDFPNVPIPRPVNLWAEIRQNHGVQTSAQFVAPVIDDSTRGAVHTLNRIRSNPNNWILCLREGTSGHCVTPFRVVDISPTQSEIHVYDNNSIDAVRTIQVDLTTGRASYMMTSGRIWDDWLVAIPISVWLNSRSAMDDLTGIVSSAVFGNASALYTNTEGGRWGVDPESDEWVEDMDQAVTVPLMDQSVGDSVPAMLVLPEGSSPTASISSAGEEYTYLTTGEGVALQLINRGSAAGNKDRVMLSSTDGRLHSFRFRPERQATGIVPRVSMKLGEETSAVFTWQGLNVPAGAEAGFTALPDQKGVAISNDSPSSMSYSLTVQLVDGTSDKAANVTFDSLNIAPGVTQRLTVTDWPTANWLRVESDADGDGAYESSETIRGGFCPPQDLDGDGFAETCLSITQAPSLLYLPLTTR